MCINTNKIKSRKLAALEAENARLRVLYLTEMRARTLLETQLYNTRLYESLKRFLNKSKMNLLQLCKNRFINPVKAEVIYDNYIRIKTSRMALCHSTDIEISNCKEFFMVLS